jgi:D-alanine-D-alanine ligase
MKVAIIYNRTRKNVINLFGTPNQEKIGKKTIQRIIDALKKGKHQVVALEGDKNLIHNLEEFMPQVLKGERPGIVFNVSYGIQGEARYTHVPGILEMVGIPYVASGPLAHSLALDKVVSKTLFRQFDIPTADFAVLQDPGFSAPDLSYPLIVKPKNEAVSFGIRVVNNEEELREAAQVIFSRFAQPVLVEQYIEGREVNVGLLGNDPPEAFPPAEIVFGETGPRVYSYEDKTGRSGREIRVKCPADLTPEKDAEARELARKAFKALGCRDCARVDMRMDQDGNFYILEINSLPSLGEHGSYTQAAEAVGLDYPGLVNRLVEVAVARYFGVPKPPPLINGKKKDPREQAFIFLTERRDQLEKRIRQWTRLSSRTGDPVGLQEARKELERTMLELKMKPVERFTDERVAWTWESTRGMKNGTLLVGHLDIPVGLDVPYQGFRRAPDRLFGEGIGCSRGPLVMMEFALSALRSTRRLKNIPLGVLYYMDEGQDNRYSAEIIRAAAAEAKQVLILRPGTTVNSLVVQHRGQAKYRLMVEGQPRRLGQPGKRLEVVRWTNDKIEQIVSLGSRKERLAIGVMDVQAKQYPMHLPHSYRLDLLVNFLNSQSLTELESKMRTILGKEGYTWSLEKISERPPMKEKRKNQQLFASIAEAAGEMDFILEKKSSLWPSPAGLVPSKAAVICGVGPVAEELYTPQESVKRISLVKRTLLLSNFLLEQGKTK